MLVNTALNYTLTFCRAEDDDDPFESRTCEMRIIEESRYMSVFSLSFSSDRPRKNMYVLCCYAGNCWITDMTDEVCVFLKNPSDINECADDLTDLDLGDDELEELGTAVKIAAHHCWCETYPDETFIRNYTNVPQENVFQKI